MNLAEFYQWVESVRGIFGNLGYWQMLGLALYSYGVLACRHCAASRVAEALVGIGKAQSVQKRLERFLSNERINWRQCCRVWSAFVLRHYVGERIILLVDETKLGANLSVMVVGLACGGWCIPLAFWAYKADEWPMGQVELIEELLCWVAEGVPDGVIPLLEADRGIGTSPALIRVVQALGWHYLFRVQGQTRFELDDGTQFALQDLVSPGGTWTKAGRAFKKAGFLPAIAHLYWEEPYSQAWCLLTNCPTLSAREYAKRTWQEGSFRDLKSDGFQWQTSHVFTPAHANLLLLVMSIAYAFVISLGTLVFEEPSLAKKLDSKRYSLFRLGLRLWQYGLDFIRSATRALAQPFFVFLEPSSLKSVRR